MGKSFATLRKVLVSALFLTSLTGGMVQAQSVVTLDSFDLDENEVSEDAQRPQSCLQNPDQDHCGLAEPSSRTFSLSDVVNLGIIDRSEVEVEDETGQIIPVEERVEALPSVDLEILFDYNSDQLRPDQLSPLVELARDLQSVDFGDAQLVLMGHTDAIGLAAYNQDLSLRRAQTVATFLSRQAGIPIYRIRTSGMGFNYLRYPNDPAHPGNRRVQVMLVE